MSEDRVSLGDVWQSPETQMPPLSLHEIAVSVMAEEQENILSRIEQYARRYCVLHESAYLPLAVWCVATHLADCFDSFPYLAILSPTPRCGKTRLLEVLELFSKSAWRGVSPTPAALYRMMESGPTLLLDEVEALKTNKASETQQALLAILNGGYRKGATVPRCDGKDHKLTHFPVYGPKAFAAIGSLPGALADRSIVVPMQRKTKAQTVERFRFTKAQREATPLKSDVARWATKHGGNIEAAYQAMDDLTFLSADRDVEIWSPLFAVCSVAEPERVPELRRAAMALCGAKQTEGEEESTSLQLLADIRSVWQVARPHIFTGELLEALRGLEESPWLEYNLNARGLAKKLRPFQVFTRTVRVGTATAKGYIREEFEGAWNRYLASSPTPLPVLSVTTTQPA